MLLKCRMVHHDKQNFYRDAERIYYYYYFKICVQLLVMSKTTKPKDLPYHHLCLKSVIRLFMPPL